MNKLLVWTGIGFLVLEAFLAIGYLLLIFAPAFASVGVPTIFGVTFILLNVVFCLLIILGLVMNKDG